MALPGERLSRAAAPDRGGPGRSRGLHPRRPGDGRRAGRGSPARSNARWSDARTARTRPPPPTPARWSRTWPRRGRDEAGRGGRPRSPAAAADPARLDDARRRARTRTRTSRSRRAARERRRSARSGTRSSGRRPRRAAGASRRSRDDEDFDEPEIPEYLIAEQRRGAGRAAAVAAVGQRGRGGPRGGRAAYQSAIDRERYGRGGGGGGINRYPDVSGRTGAGGNARAVPRRHASDRCGRPARRAPARGRAALVVERAVERGPAGARGDASGPGRRSQARPAVAPTGAVRRGRGRAAADHGRDRCRGGRQPPRRTHAEGRAEATADAQADRATATREDDDEGRAEAPRDPRSRRPTRAPGRAADAARRPRPSGSRPKRRTTRKTAATAADGAPADAGDRGRRPSPSRAPTREGGDARDRARPEPLGMHGSRTRGHPAAIARRRRHGPRPDAARHPARRPAGVGKTTLALDLAAGLLCDGRGSGRPTVRRLPRRAGSSRTAGTLTSTGWPGGAGAAGRRSAGRRTRPRHPRPHRRAGPAARRGRRAGRRSSRRRSG